MTDIDKALEDRTNRELTEGTDDDD